MRLLVKIDLVLVRFIYQSFVEPVTVVVGQTSAKIIRQLARFDVASELIRRNQDHLNQRMSADLKRLTIAGDIFAE